MNRFKETSKLYSIPLAIAAILALGLIASLGSCFFETKTTLCESSGLRCKPGQSCAANEAACIDVGGCGDDTVSGLEFCDDGNIRDGDGCSADCMSNESCGNGIWDKAVGEVCDYRDPTVSNCNTECEFEACGNRILDPGEICDDGNALSGDGCRADCKSQEACGDGIEDSYLGETCEFMDSPFPNRFPDGMTCDNDCTQVVCGDGHHNSVAGEACDPGSVGMDSMTCDRDCSSVRCGDGHRNQPAGEECDSGGSNSNTVPNACRTDCKNPICGDGIIDNLRGEDCDDRNTSNNDECPSGANGTCKMAYCGDGHRRTTGPDRDREECDGADDSLCGGRGCKSNCDCEEPPDDNLVPRTSSRAVPAP